MIATRAIFGLGNPGAQYANTRHNCGFRFVDLIASNQQTSLKFNARLQSNLVKIQINGIAVWLIQPMSFMNRSGGPFNLVCRYYQIDPSDSIVVYDDLDLPVGAVRIRKNGSAGGHNGVSDIISHSGRRDFVRVRIGIGHPLHKSNTISHVLSVPPKHDQILLDSAIADVADALPEMLTGNLEKAMTLLHSRKLDAQDSAKPTA